ASEAEITDGSRLEELLRSEPVTVWDSAPAVLEQVMPWLERRADPGAYRVRVTLLSGDWIRSQLARGVQQQLGAEVLALGGATEATIWSNYYRVGEIDESWGSVPYGRPIQNARYY